MKAFKVIFVDISFLFSLSLYAYNVQLGNGAFCWWVMLIMLMMLSFEESTYRRKLKESKKTGLCITFTYRKIVKIVNVDYFKLACEKAFEWTYIAVLWVTGMGNMFQGFGFIKQAHAVLDLSSPLSAFAGIAWCLPAVVHYAYKKSSWIFNCCLL